MSSSANRVIAAKKALRTSLRKTLAAVSPTEVNVQSGQVFTHVTSHPAFRKAQVICCYMSMPSGELDTRRIVLSILEEGKMLFVPRINHARGELDMLRIYDEEDVRSLPSDSWGIPEPGLERNGETRAQVTDLDCPPLDLIILPGLAFNCEMSRLGHGKGYYDRFLTSYRSQLANRFHTDIHAVKMPLLVGLALHQQLIKPSFGYIPTTEHDWSVDGVFHPSGFQTKLVNSNFS